MKKEQRNIYLVLTQEIDASLCSFCHYSNWQSEGCCEGYSECQHPVEALSYQAHYEDDPAPGDDCIGFRPYMPFDLFVDIVGAIITQGYNGEWAYKKYSDTQATVYGRIYGENGVKDTEVKVRIGYEPVERASFQSAEIGEAN